VKFLIDEDVAIEVARCLQNAGHNVSLVTEILGGSADDFDIWRYAISTGKILITCNRQDFLELAGTEPGAGLIILNRRRTRQAECNHLLRLIENASESGLRGNINFA